MTPIVLSPVLFITGSAIHLNRRASSICLEGGSWKISSENGESGTFDAVVLTIPVPQILQLEGDIKNILGRDKMLCTLAPNIAEYSEVCQCTVDVNFRQQAFRAHNVLLLWLQKHRLT